MYLSRHFRSIARKALRGFWALTIGVTLVAVLLGGGASVVSRHLSPKDGLCKTIFLLDDKVNAVGFERALAAVSRRKGEA